MGPRVDAQSVVPKPAKDYNIFQSCSSNGPSPLCQTLRHALTLGSCSGCELCQCLFRGQQSRSGAAFPRIRVPDKVLSGSQVTICT
mmetsp:Transcript_70643/g.153420  ORF Transcript_70643/g.153420 Transcript_70643/m.153420 type:complete len:86 (-) Transcript_70643:289-546(-)